MLNASAVFANFGCFHYFNYFFFWCLDLINQIKTPDCIQHMKCWMNCQWLYLCSEINLNLSVHHQQNSINYSDFYGKPNIWQKTKSFRLITAVLSSDLSHFCMTGPSQWSLLPPRRKRWCRSGLCHWLVCHDRWCLCQHRTRRWCWHAWRSSPRRRSGYGWHLGA